MTLFGPRRSCSVDAEPKMGVDMDRRRHYNEKDAISNGFPARPEGLDK